jgi:DNA excision repair protein ERCC-1
MHLQASSAAILVNRRQEGNPLLKCIRNVRWQYRDVIPDYQLGSTSCAIFLSLRLQQYGLLL